MKSVVSDTVAASIIVFRRLGQLILKPYAGMRKVAHSYDPYQVGIILSAVYAYFIYAVAIRHKVLNPLITSTSAFRTFGFFLITWLLVLIFYYAVGKVLEKLGKATPQPFNIFVMVFAYSLVPTLLWFIMTSTLYLLFPPPRYLTFLGKLFSIIFVVVSLTLLMWRIILWYLSLRFSYKSSFYTILTVMIIFALWFVPYSIFMYKLGVFRIPFI